MHRHLRWIAVTLVVRVVVAAGEREALAQGVTGAALVGTVTQEAGGPIDGAQVQARNASTGDTFTATTNAAGEYSLDNLPPGGPYVVTAIAPGYVSTKETGVQLTLGQRIPVDLAMKPLGEEVVVVGRRRTVLDDRGRTGAASSMKETTITELPLQGRNFTDLISTNPMVTREPGGAISIAGQNNRYNYIQIDGGANNDLFGLTSQGTPGGQSNAKPLSIEAIQEFVVQTAPFDVRQGNFTGGLVNAITKSGTNDFHGSVFGYFQSKRLAGFRDDPTFTGYTVGQYGATLGGPIIEDKLHFFVAVDIQGKQSAFGSSFNLIGDPQYDRAHAGFDTDAAQHFQNTLANVYGITGAGTYAAPLLSNPDHNVFAKLDTQLIPNSRLELSYNFVSAGQDVLIRAPTSPSLTARLRDGYQLSNSGYTISNNTNTGRVKLTTNFLDGRLSNEFLGGFSIIRDHRDIPNQLPLILVRACPGPGPNPPDPTDRSTCATGFGQLGNNFSWLAAGGDRFSQANILDQDIYQVQDNLTWALEKHRVTFGTSNEFLKIRNVFFQASIGAWAFNNLDDFDNGRPVEFQRRLALSPLQEPGTASFNVAQLGFYVQDEWTVAKNFRLTPGIRMDVPFLSKANQNPALVNNPTFPIDTSKVPTGNPLWSPRLGFNWDIDGDSSTILRGGAGIFSGRPAYVWVSNAYLGNGLSQVELTCFGVNSMGQNKVPDFTVDPNGQPSTCGDGSGPTTAANQGEIDYFDPNTKYPQLFRVALGADRRLPWGIIGSVDLMYSTDVNGWYTTDANLVNQGTNGEGRTLYGEFDRSTPTTFVADPIRVDPVTLTQAVKVYNKNGSYAYSGTLQLQKTLFRRLDVFVAYTYSRSEDRISLTSSQAFSNFQFAPVDGSLEDRNVRPSAFDRPHKVSVAGVARLPLGFGAGLTYVGQSGLPYTWVVNGDVNADGVNGNDLAYIPKDQNDISLRDPAQWDALNNFIQSQDCLKGARGRFVERGECRNPWQNFLDMRFSWISPELPLGVLPRAVKGQRLELQLDFFNVLNLLNMNWGLFKQAAAFETHSATFLQAVGYDPANKRPLYNFTAPSVVTSTVYSPTQSRWRIQLGAKYMF